MADIETEPPVTVRTFAQRFSSTRRGARLARLLAAQQLTQWGVVSTEGATLVVAELAANAVLHGRVPGRDFALRLTYDEGAALVRVEVADTHEGRPRPRIDADASGGHGLTLVAALSSAWGVAEREGPGKTVWAECPLRRPAP
ncbi:hypothetical protein C6N75_11410 [Streptomyces solincola]|uniref:Histidine kinase/HSP90-like ATPase domain-containing protein n=1 Tax=Streptomyces solincola TaxID=2100817 RepID=A0A2S9PXD0_9ACTN|nr:ATP-binding protein [Streptomyces solincola]PRH79084.1 hypothetical protein C6N75_11410 [Streptomyces solincola]